MRRTTDSMCKQVQNKLPVYDCLNAIVSQLTTTIVVRMEELGRRAASQEAPQPALLKDQLQAPTVHITRMTGPAVVAAMLLRLQPSRPKKNSPCTRGGSRHSRVPSEETSDLPAWGTSLVAPRDRAPIASTAKATGQARRVLTRTQGEQVDTHTAPPTQAR